LVVAGVIIGVLNIDFITKKKYANKKYLTYYFYRWSRLIFLIYGAIYLLTVFCLKCFGMTWSKESSILFNISYLVLVSFLPKFFYVQNSLNKCLLITNLLKCFYLILVFLSNNNIDLTLFLFGFLSIEYCSLFLFREYVRSNAFFLLFEFVFLVLLCLNTNITDIILMIVYFIFVLGSWSSIMIFIRFVRLKIRFINNKLILGRNIDGSL
jgi:hypothetical protein